MLFRLNCGETPWLLENSMGVLKITPWVSGKTHGVIFLKCRFFRLKCRFFAKSHGVFRVIFGLFCPAVLVVAMLSAPRWGRGGDRRLTASAGQAGRPCRRCFLKLLSEATFHDRSAFSVVNVCEYHNYLVTLCPKRVRTYCYLSIYGNIDNLK